MYLTRTPKFIQNLFPNFIWKMPTDQKVIYLTFDDGPIEEVTPGVLDLLSQYNAKATFFCVGDNIRKHPEIFDRIKEDGHGIGNHTYNHVSGWATDNIPYFHNVRHGANVTKSNLFRPPYGRLRPKQAQFLQRHYKIIMWDVLSGDFDPAITKEQCYQNVIDNTKQGSIIVFHDSIKSKEKLEYCLPRILEYFSILGFRFEALEYEKISTELQEKQIA